MGTTIPIKDLRCGDVYEWDGRRLFCVSNVACKLTNWCIAVSVPLEGSHYPTVTKVVTLIAEPETEVTHVERMPMEREVINHVEPPPE